MSRTCDRRSASAGSALLLACALAAGCDESAGDCPLIFHFTQVDVRLTPSGPGAVERVATWADQNVDGVADESAEVALDSGVDYLMTVELRILCSGSYAQQIRDRSSTYQLIFQGSGVSGPASFSSDALVTHEYADTDAGGLPVGLVNHLAVERPGAGSLLLTLLDLSPNSDGPQKLEGLAEFIRDTQPVDWPGISQGRFEFSLRSR